MIRVNKLSKSYGKITALKNVSFEVAKGEVLGLLGPNGAGKTTSIRLLTTFLPPSSGTASVAGFDICKQASQVRACIGYLPETPPLYPELRVKEYLRFIAQLKDVPSKQISSQVDKVLGECSLEEVKSRLCSQLSKGFRQRVGLAQALIHQPEVIILDEPTSGLDPAQIIEMRTLIKNLSEEHTVILSTHILQEVTETCSQVLILAAGEVVTQGSVSELTAEKSLEERFLEAVGR